ncbi:hypothetical protein H1215_13630 [Anoxybacillus sp. LAT_38]|uniref:hypothetical protein n=1 Tax=Anoxybacillus sp. LAT_26 TaxID=2862719 RepID=UPI001EEC6E86|nr:hypothetical protein [Anoxybacillus sp. LAT_26]MCG6184025.1 hypothetical protein [Anoxybacillus sp. LAT_26]MCG6185335.1 hypothetical protein [Anoxybacillus sp. LAT_26]MCG6198212.1 hypothetical protein [Anoxybacillus sp. LAT_38]
MNRYQKSENCHRSNVVRAVDFLSHFLIDKQVGIFPLEFGTKLYCGDDGIFRSER